MLGFGKSENQSEPLFIVGNSSLFSKVQLTPTEFGREIRRLGFQFGVAQFGQYQNSSSLSSQDITLLNAVNQNPGIIQLLYANLVAGAFLCFAKVILKPPQEAILNIEAGILTELRLTLQGMSEEIIDDHTKITMNFAIAIEREIKEIEESSSLSLFYHYISYFYPNLPSELKEKIPFGLFNSISDLGSRFLAVCQNDFQLTFKQ